jgi:hypothetical protein
MDFWREIVTAHHSLRAAPGGSGPTRSDAPGPAPAPLPPPRSNRRHTGQRFGPTLAAVPLALAGGYAGLARAGGLVRRTATDAGDG